MSNLRTATRVPEDSSVRLVCWGGRTSTPADCETRRLRNRCHELFDPLWKDRTRFKSRGGAYRWLRRFMRLSCEQNHIGMFTATQCRMLIAELEKVPA